MLHAGLVPCFVGEYLVELVVDDESEILAAPESACDVIRHAISKDQALRVEIETSQPSKPFLQDESRLRLLRVVGISDAPGQAELTLSESQQSMD